MHITQIITANRQRFGISAITRKIEAEIVERLTLGNPTQAALEVVDAKLTENTTDRYGAQIPRKSNI